MGAPCADMAELADALDLGSSPKGWGFKSLYPHQKIQTNLSEDFFMPIPPWGHTNLKYENLWGKGKTELKGIKIAKSNFKAQKRKF